MTLFSDFKQFILRGNVVDLAVAVVVGSAFVAVVNAFVKDILTPLIAAIFGKPDFSQLDFTINNSRFLYGDLINFIIAFLSIAAVVFFFVVVPDRLVHKTVNTIIKVNRTGKSGDGKIFIMPVWDSVRVRTGESGDQVLDEV